jgi:hypothetical protein
MVSLAFQAISDHFGRALLLFSWLPGESRR